MNDLCITFQIENLECYKNEQRLVKGEVTMCVGSGSKIDMIIIAHSYTFGISVERK